VTDERDPDQEVDETEDGAGQDDRPAEPVIEPDAPDPADELDA